MKVKDLENLSKSLDNIIIDAKQSIKSKDLIELEKTAFTRFEKYIYGGILLARKKVNSVGQEEKQKAIDELANWVFIKEKIEIFIDGELQDERDSIDFNG